ncbi:hypothetical protein EDB85DRAFT_2146507 [Lactarius pseudohatsudake]|nr:hypothetical protein EDB85DRAFT_2146507 [Lactarius pseudohatsudake]
MTGNDACIRTAVVITGSQLNWGMLDIPAELLLVISSHMDHRDLRGLALTSRLLCDLLLPEYLRRRGLKLKDGGTCVELHDLSGYASLELWSIAPTFRPPEKMYCSIPYNAQDALSAIGFTTRFLLDPSNASNLRNFHFSLWESDPLPIMSELIKLQDLYCVLPLTQLCISGYGSAAYLPPSITLQSGTSCGSHTLTSLSISSDLAFAPGLVRTTMGILNQSPIRRLVIYMVSLNRSQWSTLLGQLNMTLLEDIEVEGDIPRPALIRFLIKHRGLRVIHIRGNVPSDRTQPSRPPSQHFLPNLRTLHAPLTVCCDIIRRVSDPSNLYELQAEMPPSPPSSLLVRRPYARMTSGRTKWRKLDWTFDPNDETGLILHKAGKCSLCDDWSAHFYDHHAANNPTLEAALQSRDRVLQAPLQPAVDCHDSACGLLLYGDDSLRAARWREYRGDIGYFVDFASGPTRYRPVEFNFENVCWVEIMWNPIDNRWDVVRPAGRNFNCDIDARGLPNREQWGQIDGRPEEEPSTSEPRTPAPSKTSREDDQTEADDEESEVAAVTQTAELLHITEPEVIHIRSPVAAAMATITQEETLINEEVRRIREEANAVLLPIHPSTGHRMDADEAAIFRAVGPDHPDPPPGRGSPPPPRRPGGNFGGGPPRGGPPGGGFPGPPGGGGIGGAGAGMQPGEDKLTGEKPTVFTGDRADYEAFLTQWHLYWALNGDAPVLRNVYRRCLMFLGYVKGPAVSNWTLGFLTWLNNEVRTGRDRYDEYLWDTLTAGFSDRFSNVLEQEQAQAALAKGFKMVGDDIDTYVTNFEQLARKADYRLNDRQTIDRFTVGLPPVLFTKVYELDGPSTFNEWKDATPR